MEFAELIEEIEAGESKTLELKEGLPAKGEKYAKTLIAFANSAGGKLIVGVRDSDRAIIGVRNAALVADAIANALDDLCEPQIAPRIRTIEINGVDLVIAEVQPGSATPYHLKGVDLAKGTYVRVGATSRRADEHSLRELTLRGVSQTYDEQPCLDSPLDKDAVEVLCSEMNSRRLHSAYGWEITPRNLENWGLIKNAGGVPVPTRALLLLTSNPFRFARIQCGQFKGMTRSVFLDRREYGGPLQAQIDEAEAFVLRNIRLGARIEGLYREDRYEIPPEAIREAIVNAVVHRDLQANSCVQVALFDDRLEITSPGSLYGGITIEQALEGATSLRNPKIAEAFMQMDLFESWGTGLRRIRESCLAYGLPEPEFREIGNMFRVNIFRLGAGTLNVASNPDASNESLEHGQKVPISAEEFSLLKQSEKDALRIIAECGKVTTSALVEQSGLSRRSAVRVLKGLSEQGFIAWHGTSRTDPSQYYFFPDTDI